MRRYPSKNTIRLQAEVEQLTGGRCDWEFSTSANGDEALDLHIEKTGYSNHTQIFEGDSADVDSAKRRLLVLARREIKGAMNDRG